MIPALIPFKGPASAKTRLRPAVGEATERLTLAMLGDVLEALLAVKALEPVVLVTPEEGVAEMAREMGAQALVRDDPGLNEAIDAAAAEVAAGADALLVVLGDVAGARPGDLQRLLDAAPERGVALAPSRDGGTSALLRRPPDVIPPGFGPESAIRHRVLAGEAGVEFRLVELPCLAIDVDDADGLRALVASDALAPRTRALLVELTKEGG